MSMKVKGGVDLKGMDLFGIIDGADEPDTGIFSKAFYEVLAEFILCIADDDHDFPGGAVMKAFEDGFDIVLGLHPGHDHVVAMIGEIECRENGFALIVVYFCAIGDVFACDAIFAAQVFAYGGTVAY